MVYGTFERKSIPIVAWYVLSNESYMNRVIKDVFPTAQIRPSEIIQKGIIHLKKRS